MTKKTGYKPLFDRETCFIPQLDTDSKPNFTLPLGASSVDLSRKQAPYLASFLNVNTEVHQITNDQKISLVGIPLSLLAFAIGFIACHTYLGVSLMASSVIWFALTILASSVTLNTFVNTYYMLNNFYSFYEQGCKNLFGGSLLSLANLDMKKLMPDQGSDLARIVKFFLWTFGCIGLTVAAVYPFYSVDKATADKLPSYVPDWIVDILDSIPHTSEIVGLAFGGLLYNSVKQLAEKVISNLQYYGAKGINVIPGVELPVGDPVFKVTKLTVEKDQKDHEKDRRIKAKEKINRLTPKIRNLKAASIATLEGSKQYYLGLIASGRSLEVDGTDKVLDPLIEAMTANKDPDYQQSYTLLHKYNTLVRPGEEIIREVKPRETPFWQWLIGALHNPIAWVAMLGYVYKAIEVAGSVWLGVLYSSPLLILVGYMVAQPLIINAIDTFKDIANALIDTYHGKNVRLPGETWGQYFARLIPWPLHMIQNPKKMIAIMAVALAMGYFSCYVAVLLNAELFGQTLAWPFIEFMTFYMTIIFNVNPVDKVMGSLFCFCHKAFGSSEQAQRTQDEIRINEYADNSVKMINDMGDDKYFHILRDIVKAPIEDAKKLDLLRAFFGDNDLNHFIGSDVAYDNNLSALEALVDEYEQTKTFAQPPQPVELLPDNADDFVYAL